MCCSPVPSLLPPFHRARVPTAHPVPLTGVGLQQHLRLPQDPLGPGLGAVRPRQEVFKVGVELSLLSLAELLLCELGGGEGSERGGGRPQAPGQAPLQHCRVPTPLWASMCPSVEQGCCDRSSSWEAKEGHSLSPHAHTCSRHSDQPGRGLGGPPLGSFRPDAETQDLVASAQAATRHRTRPRVVTGSMAAGNCWAGAARLQN